MNKIISGIIVSITLLSNVLIASAWNGEFVSQIGSGIRGNNELNGINQEMGNPYRVISDISGNVFVFDKSNSKIRKFSNTGAFVSAKYVGNAIDMSISGNNLYVSTDNGVYVSDINLINPFGRILGNQSYGDNDKNGIESTFSYISSVKVVDSVIYVADDSVIKVYDTSGKLIFRLGKHGGAENNLSGTSALLGSFNSFDVKNGNIYIANFGGNNVKVYTLEGTFVRNIGTGVYGDSDYQFKQPMDVAVNDTHIYVADTYNHKIKIYDINGTFVRSFGGYGDGNFDLKYPKYVSISGTTLYVSETGGFRIKSYSKE